MTPDRLSPPSPTTRPRPSRFHRGVLDAARLFTCVCGVSLAPLAWAGEETPGDTPEILPTPWAVMQVWFTAYDQDVEAQADPAGYGDPEDDLGFKVRRLRVGLSASEERLSYTVSLGMSSPFDGWSAGEGELRVVDAWARYQFHPIVAGVAGMVRVPYGREQLMSSTELVFTERTIASHHIAPGQQPGALLALSAPEAAGGLEVGVFNGNSSLIGDDNPGVLAAARLSGQVGGADTMRTFGVVDGPSAGGGLNAYINRDLTVTELAYGADVALRVGGLAAMVQFDAMQITPTGSDRAPPEVLAQTTRLSLMGQVGYSAGPVEPALRVEWYDDNRGFSDNGDVLIAMIGGTVHLQESRIRMGGGFVRRVELGGQTLANDSARIWLQLNSLDRSKNPTFNTP